MESGSPKIQEEIQRLSKFPSENPSPVLRVAGDGTVMYANESSRSLLDAWSADQGGDWTLDYSITCPEPTPTQNTTWGQIKSTY